MPVSLLVGDAEMLAGENMRRQKLRQIPVDRVISIGVPLILSLFCLILGYSIKNIPFQVLGWGSAFLTIVFTYLEYKLPQKHPVKGYKILQEAGDPIEEIIGLLKNVKQEDEIYSVATVPSYPDYETAYIEAVCRACAGVSQNGIFCLRIIANQEKRKEMRDMYDEMSNFRGIYAPLKEHQAKIKVIKMDKPLGVDTLLIAQKNSKIALLGIKEASPNSYFNELQGQHINRGNTYVFENDNVADSLYKYYVNFISEEI